MCAKRLERHHKEAVVKDLQKGNRTYAQLSRKHSISVSTVHRIAEEAGLTVRRARTGATQRPEETYSRERRIGVLDTILKSVEDQVSKGGLSSKQLLDVSRAAKELTAARQNEDKLPDPDEDPFKDKKDERGWVDVGLGDIRIHESDPLLKDMIKIERGIDPWEERNAQEKAEREAAAREAEFDGQGLA